jgi:hypothetical protein
MKKSFFSLVFLLYCICSFSQTDGYNQKIMDPKANKEILIGYCTRDGLMSSVFSSYFKDGYGNYKPDPDILKEILPKTREVIITIVMGTWCSDSQEQVPRFFKILDVSGYQDAVTIICVDKDKKAGSIPLEGMNIEKVPTIIFYRDNKELGRIIESPAGTLEKDMLAILSK